MDIKMFGPLLDLLAPARARKIFAVARMFRFSLS